VPAAALVYCAAKCSSGGPERAAARICRALGDASYSIYLIQFFTLPVIARAIHAVFEGRAPNLIFFAGFFGTLLSGYACHRYVERSLQRLGHAWLRSASATPS
jgi:peptidoglycan/LPS O-acetylase OafA/YrhL